MVQRADFINTCNTWVPKLASISEASIPSLCLAFSTQSQCGVDTASSGVSLTIMQHSLPLSAFLSNQVHTIPLNTYGYLYHLNPNLQGYRDAGVNYCVLLA